MSAVDPDAISAAVGDAVDFLSRPERLQAARRTRRIQQLDAMRAAYVRDLLHFLRGCLQDRCPDPACQSVLQAIEDSLRILDAARRSPKR